MCENLHILTKMFLFRCLQLLVYAILIWSYIFILYINNIITLFIWLVQFLFVPSHSFLSTITNPYKNNCYCFSKYGLSCLINMTADLGGLGFLPKVTSANQYSASFKYFKAWLLIIKVIQNSIYLIFYSPIKGFLQKDYYNENNCNQQCIAIFW
jgi:hypothetical protein